MNKVLIRLPGYDKYAINYLRRRDIDILNITYQKDGNVYTIYESDVEKLDIDLIEVVSYRGSKRIISSIKNNLHLLIATFVSVAIMSLISNVVVEVEVIHSNKDVRVLIEDELYDRGVKSFIFKKTFDQLQAIKDDIRAMHPEEIEWLEINDEGMKYVVRVEERIITKPIEESPYCNVISTKDARVISAVAKKGQTTVLPNDFVKKDSILISGKITMGEKTKSHVCALGDVYGNTWYRVSISVPLNHTHKNYTGKEKSNVGFEFGSTYKRIFKVHFDEYDVEKKKLLALGKFALYKEKVLEYTEDDEFYSEEEALEEALKQAREKLLIKLDVGAEIEDEKVLQSSTYDSIINVEIFYSVREIIGRQVEATIEPEPLEEQKP